MAHHDTGSGLDIDDTNKAIVEQLQEDGRRSYAAVGKAVGLSEAATRQRVQRLVEAGVMQIVAVTDPIQMGFARQAMIGISTEGTVTGIADAIAEVPAVNYCVITAGHYDVIAEVVAEDDQDLLRIISNIREVQGVTTTDTLLYLSLRYQSYNWGTR